MAAILRRQQGAGTIRIESAGPDGIETILSWAKSEGWNPGIDDAAPFRAADPDGFLVGRVDGATVACISVVRYGADFGFLGFYICHPEWRGRGHGWAIWQAGMERLSGRTVGLDGVVAQQANYAKSGFVLAHRNIRFGGAATSQENADPNLVELGTQSPSDLAPAIVDYDRPFFPASRESFLRRWIEPGGRRTLAFVEDGRILGYGCVRPCASGSKIGPLFAETPDIAERIFVGLTGPLRGMQIFLDVPEPNESAVALAARHALAPVFETARMYRGSTPHLPLERVYGITTFELG